MLVYGDHEDIVDPATCAAAINRRLAALAEMTPGLERHGALTAALIEAGRLQQGIADHLFAQGGQCDRKHPLTDQLGAALLDIGRALCRSWDSGFAEMEQLPRIALGREAPAEASLRLPEGFAFYALYPEAYIDAARRLELAGPARVIGLRSIGTALGAVAAAALDAPVPVTLRPFGDSFNREINMDQALERELLDGHVHYVIVDEGPGQSGSSFAAVADWLRARDVPDERIALLPSHPGAPGPAATGARRRWWQSVQRQSADHGDRLGSLLQGWAPALLGRLDGPLEEITGTGPWDRRKFLASAGGERFLLKFCGLGSIGEDKLRIAGALFSEKLCAEPVGLLHGFLAERWIEGSPVAPGDKPIREIGRYIGTRARLLRATSGSGASIDELLRMVRRNASVEFGDTAKRALEEVDAAKLQRRVIRIPTDNKMQPHEWLRTAAGRLLKTDALDHHRAHDLIGCQDFAWDVAGAIVEFGLDDTTAAQLIAVAEEYAGREVDSALLAFYRIAYLAFRLGQCRLGETMITDASERQRIDGEGDGYAADLRLLLQDRSAATRQQSLVD